MADANHPRRNFLIGLALGLITLAVYLPATAFDFTNFDDNLYVTDNFHLTHGSLAQRLAWAFTSGYAVNWHPVTWISHMLDVWIYGMKPAGHHLTNVLLHVANSVLLFGLLLSWTGKTWRCAFVAALFALHPLHVESVAWVAERKDVLSMLFGLLTMWAYTRYVEKARIGDSGFKVDYVLALFFFAIGLMSKPMLVTLPLILLLLDIWPLWRLPNLNSRAVGRLLSEKIPFFILTILSSAITFLVQRSGGAMGLVNHLGVGERLANALVTYVRYSGKILWPHDLAVLYPYQRDIPAWLVLAAVAFLAVPSLYALSAIRKRPYVTVGWFWFLISLVPVIGIVQVGEQALADRYTYLPSIGFFIMMVWLLADVLAERRWTTRSLSAAAAGVLGVCLVATSLQLRYWQNSITLFTHSITSGQESPTIYNNLGGALNAEGYYDLAIDQFKQALKLRQDWDIPNCNMGIALLGQGKAADAIPCLQQAVKLNPEYVDAWINLGNAFGRLGKWDEAMADYRKALTIFPSPEARNRMGGAFESQGKVSEALEQYTEALKLDPDFSEAHVNIASILNAQGRFAEARPHLLSATRAKPSLAAAHSNLANSLSGLGEDGQALSEYETALRLNPKDAETHLDLGNLLARQQQWDAAIVHFEHAIRLDTNLVQAHLNLATILSGQGRAADAIQHYRAALQVRSNDVSALKNLAWLLATIPDGSLRNGEEAVRLATLATQQGAGSSDAGAWLSLAAAFAETGHFPDAVAAAQKALDLANAQSNKELAARVQGRLESYRAGKVLR